MNTKLDEISGKIEELRTKLHNLAGSTETLHSSEMVKMSCQLDDLIMEHYRLTMGIKASINKLKTIILFSYMQLVAILQMAS